MSKEQLINNLKALLDDNNEEKIEEEYFEWRIYDWLALRIFQTSPSFRIGGYQWRVALLPDGYTDGENEYVSLYLGNFDVEKDKTLKIYADFVFIIRNFNDYSCYISQKTTDIVCFDINNTDYHFPQFIKKDDLTIPIEGNSKALMECNRFVIGVYVRVYNKH